MRKIIVLATSIALALSGFVFSPSNAALPANIAIDCNTTQPKLLKPTITGIKPERGRTWSVNPFCRNSPGRTFTYEWYACDKQITSLRSSFPPQNKCSKIYGDGGLHISDKGSGKLRLAKAQQKKFVTVLMTVTIEVSPGINQTAFFVTKSTARVS
jgi:hypothetical protein